VVPSGFLGGVESGVGGFEQGSFFIPFYSRHRARFLGHLVAHESHQSPIGIKRMPQLPASPWRLLSPQKNVGSKLASKRFITDSGADTYKTKGVRHGHAKVTENPRGGLYVPR
jgi:hypothetical protein